MEYLVLSKNYFGIRFPLIRLNPDYCWAINWFQLMAEVVSRIMQLWTPRTFIDLSRCKYFANYEVLSCSKQCFTNYKQYFTNYIHLYTPISLQIFCELWSSLMLQTSYNDHCFCSGNQSFQGHEHETVLRLSGKLRKETINLLMDMRPIRDYLSIRLNFW